MSNKTTKCNGYNRTEMEVKVENLSKVLMNLGKNEKVFSIDVHYIDIIEPKAIVRFAWYE